MRGLPKLAILLLLMSLAACSKFDLGAGGQLDYARRWKDRYVCRPASEAARDSLGTCEVRFLSAGGMLVRVRDRHFDGLSLEVFLTTRIETDRAFIATCESVSGSDSGRPVYQRPAGEAPQFTDEAKRPAFERFLADSALLREALPKTLIECRSRGVRFEVKEKTLTARDESGGFQFTEALAE